MKVTITTKAQKSFLRLPRDIQQRLSVTIDRLKDNPYPPKYKKLTNRPGYRIRVGDFRILYLVDLKRRALVFTRIARRGSAYR